MFRGEGIGFGRGFEMATAARSLAETGTFGDPFSPFLTGPTAAIPPLYPLFLAALIKVFRQPASAVFVASFASVVINAFVASALPRLSAVFYGAALPGIFAGLLWMFSVQLMPQWDVSYTVSGIILFCLLISNAADRKTGGLRQYAAGVTAGLLALLNPLALLICALWTGFLFQHRRPGLDYALRTAAKLVFAAALCVLPWLWRNYLLWHAVVVRTNFGMTVYVSNNDCAQSSISRSGDNGCFQAYHPVGSESEAALLRKLGEVEYDRLRTADALRWIRDNPVRFQELTRDRIVEFWFPENVVSRY
ncbi:MAG: hypothetical protein JJE04_20340, partial [Acidobacteriia bacterium]|nr:hypothetical protein [Terriglobia bacterium]